MSTIILYIGMDEVLARLRLLVSDIISIVALIVSIGLLEVSSALKLELSSVTILIKVLSLLLILLLMIESLSLIRISGLSLWIMIGSSVDPSSSNWCLVQAIFLQVTMSRNRDSSSVGKGSFSS